MDGKKKSPWKIIKSVICYFVVAVMIIVFAFVMISKINGKMPFLFDHTVVWVLTESMAPEIQPQSYILVEKITAADVNLEDVIVFISDDPALNGNRNTHRVKEIIGDHEEFVMRGDHNFKNDDYNAKAANVEGRYVKVLPVFTSIGRFLSTSMGLVMTVTLIFIFLIALYLPDIRRATEETQQIIEDKKKQQIDDLVKAEVEKMKMEGTGELLLEELRKAEQKRAEEEAAAAEEATLAEETAPAEEAAPETQTPEEQN